MLKTEAGGVQRDALRPAGVGQGTAVTGSVVDALAAQGRPCLSQMNPDLVRPAGLQAALDQRESSEVLDDADVRHGPLPLAGRPAAAPAVAAVAHQPGFDRRLLRLA